MSAESSRRSRNASRGRLRFSTGDRVIRIQPDDPTTTFVEIEDEPVGAYTNHLPEETLPGFGVERDDCGDDIPHFCTDCGHVVGEVGRTCYRWECPRCAPAAVMRRSITATAKIEDFRKETAYQRGGDSPKFHHVVLSPPEDFAVARNDPKEAAYDIAKTLLDELGAMGGLLAYHPWRGDIDGQTDDRGAWKNRLFNDRDWDDVRAELAPEGHIHAIAVADYIDHHTCAALNDKTDWIIHRIEKTDSNVSLYDVEDLASATTYTLSHTGLEADGSASYRYFGAVANHAADETTEARMREVVRSVVPTTLGLSVADLTCDRTLSDDETDESHQHAPRGNGDGSESGSDENDTQTDESHQETTTCSGRLLPLSKADRFLKDDDWLASAPCSDELRDARRSWPPPD